MSLVYFVPNLGSWDPKRVFEISEQLLKLALLKFTKEFLMEEALTAGGGENPAPASLLGVVESLQHFDSKKSV